jgi:hypothetical protein
MTITNPIPGFDSFMVLEREGLEPLRMVFERSSKFTHIARPGAQHKGLGALNLDFIVRAKDTFEAEALIAEVWGGAEAEEAEAEA